MNLNDIYCDFCGAGNGAVSWRYPARSSPFVVSGQLIGMNYGDWAACDACHSIIERGDSDALARRTLASPAMNGFVVGVSTVKSMHQEQFFNNRTGVAERYYGAA